jgi:hypothetical protein
MIDQILDWGRANANGSKKAIDTAGHFDRSQTEAWRKELRRRFKDGERHIDGSWRQGYELVLPTGEAIGVTNGHASHFVIYYRKGAIYYG